jgi:hypothetical protein
MEYNTINYKGEHMNWLYLVIFIVIGLLLFIRRLKNKSQLMLFFAGMALIISILYLSKIQNWLVLLPLVPAISLAFSHLIKKKLNNA